MNRTRWQRLLQCLGIDPVPETAQSTYRALAAAYAEPHRQYHTAEHIGACLLLLDEYTHLADSALEIEIALWFHDAIYILLSPHNEEKSAAWCSRFLTEVNIDEPRIHRIHTLILATTHEAAPNSNDTALIADIDLSILGRDSEQYDRFERAIRQEYKSVPWMLYRRTRRQILQSFLARETIYTHLPLRQRFETQARSNLAAAIKALE
jgi:predicted metal-dependent HD superfamily phosphohydrolase